MNPQAPLAEEAAQQTDLLGLKFSAGLLVVFGCFSGFYAIAAVVVSAIASVRALDSPTHNPGQVRWFMGAILIAIVMSALTWLSFRAARALRGTRRWGAYVASAFGLLLLLFTADFVYDMYHPERQSTDEGDGIVLMPFILFVALWWCVYPNLPHVRARLKSVRSS